MGGDTEDEAATACVVFAAETREDMSDQVADILYSSVQGGHCVTFVQSHMSASQHGPLLSGSLQPGRQVLHRQICLIFLFS